MIYPGLTKKNLHEVDYDLLQAMVLMRPNIKPGRRGKVFIEQEIKPAGEKITVVSGRNALMMGQRAASVIFDKDFTISYLKDDDNGTWMSDSPQEIYQMRDPINKARGRVLVGGLGLGVYPHLLVQMNKDVDSVVVVEKDVQITMLVSPYMDKRVEVKVFDLYKYLKRLSAKLYDFGFFDIWQGTGEGTWVEHVVPLRRLARGKIKKLLCWNEDEMKGQLISALPTKAVFDDSFELDGFVFYQEVFRRYAQSKGIKPTINKKDMNTQAFFEKMFAAQADKQILKILDLYLKPGTDQWERHFGKLWDELLWDKLREDQ